MNIKITRRRKKMARTRGSGKYPLKYTNPLTGVLSDNPQYIDEQGNKHNATATFCFVEGKWVSMRNDFTSVSGTRCGS